MKRKFNNHKMLNDWLFNTLTDRPELMNKATTPNNYVDFYNELHNIWLDEVRQSMIEITPDIIKIFEEIDKKTKINQPK